MARIKRPKARKAPKDTPVQASGSPQEPSKSVGPSPVALSDLEPSTGRVGDPSLPPSTKTAVVAMEKGVDYVPMDPESIYDRLSYQGKMKAKYAAEQRGVTLRTLFEKWPQFSRD